MHKTNQPKIVVLDGFALNPGDLSWDTLKQLGDCKIFDRTPEKEIISRARDAEILLTNKCPLRREIISQLPRLRYIGVTATGVNVVDLDASRERNILVTNAPDYSTPSVAQHVFALLLELTNRVGHHSQTVREGKWHRSNDWCYRDFPIVELAGLTLGIVGYGKIGRAVAELGTAFGMNVIATTRTQRPDIKIRFVPMEDLLRESDVVTLHCPLSPETKNIINAERLALMKSTAFIINTSRGPLVVERDLADALKNRRIAGAGLDVLSMEPPTADNELVHVPNCIITPHIAWASRASRSRLMEMVVENLRAFLSGSPKNVVNAIPVSR